MISTKPTQGQRRKKKNHIMQNWFQALVPAPLCRGSSEFPVLPSQHGRSRIAGSLTRQATEKAWINPGLPNAHHVQPGAVKVGVSGAIVVRCRQGGVSPWLYFWTSQHNFCTKMRRLMELESI